MKCMSIITVIDDIGFSQNIKVFRFNSSFQIKYDNVYLSFIQLSNKS